MAWSAPLYRAYERRLLKSLPPDQLPSHVGVILDGHRRFARAEGLADYTASYRTGMVKLRELLGWSAQLHLPAVTAWVLSTDNLRRPRERSTPISTFSSTFSRICPLSRPRSDARFV